LSGYKAINEAMQAAKVRKAPRRSAVSRLVSGVSRSYWCSTLYMPLLLLSQRNSCATRERAIYLPLKPNRLMLRRNA